MESNKKAAIDGHSKLFNIGAFSEASQKAESAPVGSHLEAHKAGSAPVAVASLLEAIPEATTMAASSVHDPPAVVADLEDEEDGLPPDNPVGFGIMGVSSMSKPACKTK